MVDQQANVDSFIYMDLLEKKAMRQASDKTYTRIVDKLERTCKESPKRRDHRTTEKGARKGF